MTRSWLGALGLIWLCVLGACGPGVRGKLEDAAPRLNLVESELVDVEGRTLRLRVAGSGFSASSVVHWRGQALDTTYVDVTTLRAVFPVEEGMDWALAALTVRDVEAGLTSEARLPVPAPTPQLVSVSAGTFGAEGSTVARLTLSGRGFTTGSQLEIWGASFLLTVLTPETAEVDVPLSRWLEEGPEQQLAVAVQRPRPARTNVLVFHVRLPVLEGVHPPVLSVDRAGSQPAGGINVYVRNLHADSVVKWNGLEVARIGSSAEYSSTYVSLPEGARAAPGTATVTVETPGPGGGVSAAFTVQLVDAPVVQYANNTRIQAGAERTGLSLQGEGFEPDMEAYWDDKVLPATPVTPPAVPGVSVEVPGTELARPGFHLVRVRRKRDGAVSGPILVEVSDKVSVPVANGLVPGVVTAGDAPVRLRVEGGGMQPGSIIQLDGQDRPTRDEGFYARSIALLESDLAVEGTHTVTVRTPGVGTSLPLRLKVDARRPEPRLSGLSVPFVRAGSGNVTFYVSGTGLGRFSQARWNGLPLTTRWESICCDLTYRLAVEVPAALLVEPAVARVQVFNGGPGGGLSNGIDLPILAQGSSAPALVPQVIEAGDSDVTVEVVGSGFDASTRVLLGDSQRVPTLVNNTRVTLKLDAQDLATERTLALRTTTGSGISAAQSLHVIAPRTPVLRGVIPGVLSVGQWAPGVTHTVGLKGDGLGRRDVVDWNAHVSASLSWGDWTLAARSGYSRYLWGPGPTAQLDGGAVAALGTFEVTASRAHEGAGTSLPVLVHVVQERPVPLLSNLEPRRLRPGLPSQVLRVRGEGFQASSVVHWDGEPLRTRWLDGELQAVVPAALLATPGTVQVTVRTPAPGGGESLPLWLLVENG